MGRLYSFRAQSSEGLTVSGTNLSREPHSQRCRCLGQGRYRHGLALGLSRRAPDQRWHLGQVQGAGRLRCQYRRPWLTREMEVVRQTGTVENPFPASVIPKFYLTRLNSGRRSVFPHDGVQPLFQRESSTQRSPIERLQMLHAKRHHYARLGPDGRAPNGRPVIPVVSGGHPPAGALGDA